MEHHSMVNNSKIQRIKQNTQSKHPYCSFKTHTGPTNKKLNYSIMYKHSLFSQNEKPKED